LILLLFIKRNKHQIIKFLITGLLSSFLNFIVYSILYKLSIDINLASFAGYCIGLINSFLFSKLWIFGQTNTKRLKRTFIFFTLIYLIGGIEMIILINLGIYFLGNYKIAWLIGASIAAINNYIGSKFLIFEKWLYFSTYKRSWVFASLKSNWQ